MTTTMTTTNTTTKWNVEIGSYRLAISKDLLVALGYTAPYSNDETGTAVYARSDRAGFSTPLAVALATGLTGDAAALEAIRLADERQASYNSETARQKIAEIELKTAQERRAAEAIALAHFRERQ